MALANTWFFTRTVIDWDKIAKATRNRFSVVSVREYADKKGKLPNGYMLTIKVLHDDFDYGTDKNGNPRENNVDQNFEVYVLTRKHHIKKGDIIRLLDFDAENSHSINFELILRFRDCEVLPKPARPTI